MMGVLFSLQTDRKMIRNMVWDVVKADLDKLAVTTDSLREEQVEYCRRNNLTLTPQFKQQLQHLTTTLESSFHLLLFGNAVTQKTSLWRAATVIRDYEVMVVSRSEQDLLFLLQNNLCASLWTHMIRVM